MLEDRSFLVTLMFGTVPIDLLVKSDSDDRQWRGNPDKFRNT